MAIQPKRPAFCTWCNLFMGTTSKDYCSPRCKQSHYRYRKRGMELPRRYRRRQTLDVRS